MNLKLEDGENPGTLFFEEYVLRKEVERHGETISDRTCKGAVIRAIPISYNDVKFAFHRDHSFSLEQIQWTMINTYRATEREESENVGIGSRKTAVVAVRRARSRKVVGQPNALDALNVDSWAIAKTDCSNRDTTKIGRGGGQMGVTHKKAQRGDKSGK